MNDGPAKPMQVILLEWKPLAKGSLIGFADVRIGALTIRGIPLLISHGRVWASLPSKPMVGNDGRPLTDENGKARYVSIMEWATSETRGRFSNAVIEAVEAAHPGATSIDGSA